MKILVYFMPYGIEIGTNGRWARCYINTFQQSYLAKEGNEVI